MQRALSLTPAPGTLTWGKDVEGKLFSIADSALELALDRGLAIGGFPCREGLWPGTLASSRFRRQPTRVAEKARGNDEPGHPSHQDDKSQIAWFKAESDSKYDVIFAFCNREIKDQGESLGKA